MKVSFKKSYFKTTESIIVELGENKLVISDTKFIINVKEGSKQFFFQGELYYSIKEDKFVQIYKNEYTEFLKNKLNNFDPVEFINSVEGVYNCVYIDSEKDTAVIFCDYLNRSNYFYTERNNEFSASTSLDTIIPELEKIEYNQQALHSYLMLGYAPKYQTFYSGIKRFNNNEYIIITNGKIEHKIFSEEYKIINYDNSYLDKYDSLISNSVTSRASSENVVLNSGGWDSTSIIYLLSKSFSSDKINSIVYETRFTDGTVFNIYESDKVKRISEYYSIKSEICQVDFSDKNLLNDWEKVKGGMKKYHTYFFVDMPKIVSQALRDKNELSVFSGEASDSIHNFGFSQFVSVNFNNKNLREYADKMKSYLYGPDFFSKIENGSYMDDRVFQFFRVYFGESSFENSEGEINSKIFLYLKSFMLSSQRVPFAKINFSKFANRSFASEFDKSISNEIFNTLAADITETNLYYCLLQLYRIYHFHSPQIEVKHTALRNQGSSCKIPFLDSSLLKFMYSMPQSWGRGLEIRPTKYPLRKLASERWNIPNHILNEDGPHSYISETDKKWNYSGGNWDLYCEIVHQSVFTDYFRTILKETDLEKYFSAECFDTLEMKSVIEDFIEGKEDVQYAGFIYKLGILFSAGLY